MIVFQGHEEQKKEEEREHMQRQHQQILPTKCIYLYTYL